MLSHRIFSIIFFSVFFGIFYFVTSKTKADEVLIFAASSLTLPLQEIARFHNKPSENKVRFSFGASSTLARQIVRGAPAHLYVSANQKWVNFLIKENLVDQSCNKNLLSNELALITSRHNTFKVNNLPEIINKVILSRGRLAVGNPSHVPLGIYTKQALQNLRLWTKLKSKMAPLPNARSVLAFIERDEAIAGIVYKSDTHLNKKIKIIYNFPIASHKKITYFAAPTYSARIKEVLEFCESLNSSRAKNIFKQYGFLVD
mgnify:CR=1 FL=1